MDTSKSGSVKTARLTVDIPEAGRMLGIGKNAAYDAAKRGQIPTIHLGKRRVVPLGKLRAMLGGGGEGEAA